MERLLTSRLFPVLATSLGGAAGAGAVIGYGGDVIAATALGIALAAAIMTLRNWLVSEEERPLLAEELLGMHEHADALRAETREMRRMLTELTSIVEEILADNESETALATDRATASLMAARLDQTERRLLAAEESLNKLGGGGPNAPRVLSQEAVAALTEDSDLATLAQQATAARRLVNEVSERLDEHDQRAGKLAQALSIAVREARNNAERLQELERLAREAKNGGGGSGGASSGESGGDASSPEPKTSSAWESGAGDVKAVAAISEPEPKQAKQPATRAADAASVGAARSTLSSDAEARAPRAQAEAVGIWRGAARVSAEAPDASGAVREPLLPLGGLPATFTDWQATPDNDAAKPALKTKTAEMAETLSGQPVAQDAEASKPPAVDEAAESAEQSAKAQVVKTAPKETAAPKTAKAELQASQGSRAAANTAMSPTRMALREVRDAEGQGEAAAEAKAGVKAVVKPEPVAKSEAAADSAAILAEPAGSNPVEAASNSAVKPSRLKVRVVDSVEMGREKKPSAKIVKSPVKQVGGKTQPLVRLVETSQDQGQEDSKPPVVKVAGKASTPAQIIAAMQVDEDAAEPQPGEDLRHQLALQPILRLSDLATVYCEAIAPEDLVLDDPDGGGEDIANVMVVRSMSVVDQFRRNGSDANVFCNVSMTMLRRKEFLTRFMECLDSRRDLSDQLILEFHQSEVGGIETSDEEVLSGIQDAGFSFSMDHVVDWEAGIERLSEIGFRYIKLDASDFMAQIRTEAKAESLLAELRNLKLELIVENVDTSLQREGVMAAGAPYAQGRAINEPKLVRLD